MPYAYRPLPQGAVKLLPGIFQHRAGINRDYVVSLRTEALLQNFYLEAGLGQAIFRLPEWLQGQAEASANGAPQPIAAGASGFHEIRRVWRDDIVELSLPKGLWVNPIPDAPEKVAFMDGPVALAGLCEDETALIGDIEHPEQLLAPDNERAFGAWSLDYRTRRQPRNLRFTPLYAVTDEPYTVYFPVQEP